MNEKKIDIERIANLLNGFNDSNLSVEEKETQKKKREARELEYKQIQKKAKKFSKELMQNTNEDSINLDLESISHALSVEGKTTGLVKTVKLKDAANILESKSEELQLSDAKNIVIIFSINSNTSLFSVNEIMTSVDDLTSNDTNLEFGCFTDDSLNEDEVLFRLMASGI